VLCKSLPSIKAEHGDVEVIVAVDDLRDNGSGLDLDPGRYGNDGV
jgi:hypothetical protein